MDLTTPGRLDLIVVEVPQSAVLPVAIERSGPNQLRLSSPTGFFGYFLQTTTNVSAPWQTLLVNPSNALECVTTTILPQQFFRLWDPETP